jgi:DNA-binding beta-propeller fold protein YncE
MNTNIEELYKKKYLKYKAKYLNLQRGGVIFTHGRHNYNYFGRVDKLPISMRVGKEAGFMALDGNGNIAVADTQNNSVVIIDLKTGKIINKIETTAVTGVAFDRDKIYIGHFGNVEFRRYDVIDKTSNYLECPKSSSIACKDGYVYILSGDRIYVYEEPGQRYGDYLGNNIPIHKIGSPGSESGQFSNAKSIAFDREGNIVVADTGNNRIQVIIKKITPKSDSNVILLHPTDVRIIGSPGSNPGQFKEPIDFSFNDDNSQIIVADTGNNRVQILDYKTGIPISKFIIFKPKGIVYYSGKDRTSILVSTTNLIQVLDPLKFEKIPVATHPAP